MLGLFAKWHQHKIPTIQTIRAAVGHHIAGQPQAILGRVGEQVAGAATVNARDRLRWWLGGTRLELVVVVAHLSS